MTEMIYGVKVKQGLFSPDECARLIALDYPWESSQVSDAGPTDVVNPTGKTAEYKLLPLEPATEWIYQRLSQILQASGAFGFAVEEIGVPLKVQMYAPGGFHAWHTDIGNPKNTRRKIAISTQLCGPDDYGGGELQFFDHPDPVVGPKDQGCAIFYPAFLPHRVTEVTRGKRYALTAWCLGPPFK